MSRMWAIVERELRRFRRSPILIVVSMIFPLCQLVILGYAFGGNVKHLRLAVVDQDHGLPAVKIRELAQAASSGARTVDLIDYADEGQAVNDLRNGREPTSAQVLERARNVDKTIFKGHTPRRVGAILRRYHMNTWRTGGRTIYRAANLQRVHDAERCYGVDLNTSGEDRPGEVKWRLY